MLSTIKNFFRRVQRDPRTDPRPGDVKTWFRGSNPDPLQPLHCWLILRESEGLLNYTPWTARHPGAMWFRQDDPDRPTHLLLETSRKAAARQLGLL